MLNDISAVRSKAESLRAHTQVCLRRHSYNICWECPLLQQQAVTAKTATAHIIGAAQIAQLYLPSGVNVYSHVIMVFWAHASLSASALRSVQPFCISTAHDCDQQTNRQTHWLKDRPRNAKTRIASARIYTTSSDAGCALLGRFWDAVYRMGQKSGATDSRP